MRNCDECGRNEWKFKHENGMTVCKCGNCGNEMRFAAKAAKSKGKCECGGSIRLVARKITDVDLLSTAYCTHDKECVKCRRRWPDVDTLVVN